jgi:hypothetical protein
VVERSQAASFQRRASNLRRLINEGHMIELNDGSTGRARVKPN